MSQRNLLGLSDSVAEELIVVIDSEISMRDEKIGRLEGELATVKHGYELNQVSLLAQLASAKAELAKVEPLIELCREQDAEHGRVVGENYRLKRELARARTVETYGPAAKARYLAGAVGLDPDLETAIVDGIAAGVKDAARAMLTAPWAGEPFNPGRVAPVGHGCTRHGWSCCDAAQRTSDAAANCGGKRFCHQCQYDVALLHGGETA